MGRPRKKSETETEPVQRRRRPALSPEARENQLIALAVDRVEERLLNGTASSQEIVHFLRLGSMKSREEQEILRQQRELLEAKTEALRSAKRVEELYEGALQAMKAYGGQVISDEDD